MDPESIKNTPSYLVLAYGIQWDDSVEENIVDVSKLPRYVLLDLRAYQRPAELGEAGLLELVMNRLSDMYDYSVMDVKIKVVEDSISEGAIQREVDRQAHEAGTLVWNHEDRQYRQLTLEEQQQRALTTLEKKRTV